MSVTSGFFNSVNHDRLYDAEQISSMFDGIITDGIYQGIGDAFIVKPYSELNNTVTVGTGRAWFDHTWTKNDTELPITLEDPNVLYDRIDAIVIDVDRRQDVRANSIKVVKGTVSEFGATKPTLIEEELHNQYPLAYVTVKAGSASPVQAQYIENAIGQTKTPLVAGVLDHMDITMFVQQMEDEFNTWFEGLKDVVSGDAITNLQQQVNEIKEGSPVTKKTVMDIVKNGNPDMELKTLTLPNGRYPKGVVIPGSDNLDDATFADVYESLPDDQSIILPNGNVARFGIVEKSSSQITLGLNSAQHTYTASLVFYVTITTPEGVVTEKHSLVTKNYPMTYTSNFTSPGYQTRSFCYVSNINAETFPVTATLSSLCNVFDSLSHGINGKYWDVLFTSNINIDAMNNVVFTNSVSDTVYETKNSSMPRDHEKITKYPAIDDSGRLILLGGYDFYVQGVRINDDGSSTMGTPYRYWSSGDWKFESPCGYGFCTPGSSTSLYYFETPSGQHYQDLHTVTINNSTLEITNVTIANRDTPDQAPPSTYNTFNYGTVNNLKATNILNQKTKNGTNITSSSEVGQFISPAFSMGLSLLTSADPVIISDFDDIKVAYMFSGNNFRGLYYDEEDKIGAYDYLHSSLSFPSVNTDSAFRNKYRKVSNDGHTYLLYDAVTTSFNDFDGYNMNTEHTLSLISL